LSSLTEAEINQLKHATTFDSFIEIGLRRNTKYNIVLPASGMENYS